MFLAATLAGAVGVSAFTRQASASTMEQLSASQVVADMGAGWNLGNSMEANANGYPNETAWNNPTVTQALIDRVKAAGFKTIRIPVSYLRHIGSGPDYTISSAWLNRVQQVVDYAHSRGLYVLINIHGDGYKTVDWAWLICDSSDQATIKAKYQKVWQQIAYRFKDYDERLIFESMNEVFDGQYGEPTQPCYSNINAYNQIFVDTVRQTGGNNAARWLLVPGWNTNIDYTAGDYGFVLPTDNHRSPTIPSNEQRIMISVHYYSPWDFAGEENGTITQWGSAATDPSRTSTWGQEDYLDSQLKKMYDTFVVKGYPVVVGEYGAVDKSSADSSNGRYRADFAHAIVATAKKYGAATVYWDNGVNGQYGFGLFDRHSNAVTQQGIVDAIMSAVGDDGPPPEPGSRFEAESSPAVCQGTIDSNHAGFSGSGFCNGDQAVGAYVEFTVTPQEGLDTEAVGIRYANGGTSARPANVIVNGTTVDTVSFDPTGSWSTWMTTSVPVSLHDGANTIRIEPTTTTGLPNVDYLDLETAPEPEPDRLEAEDAPATCDGTIDTNHSGYSGSGFCNGNNAAGAAAQFTATAAEAGSATVQVRFANGSSDGARPANLIVNGTTADTTSFETSGAWSTWSTKTLTVTLNTGSNTIRLDPTTTAGLPNIDYIEISPTT